jgi:hypothetical protein
MDIFGATKVAGMKVSELEAYVGGLGKPSKMPGLSYGISAKKCITGGKLQSVKGSTCNGCYAMKGHYVYETVSKAHDRRLKSISKKYWVEAMSELLNRKKCDHFRWHDSGDLQSVDHFAKICAVAENTPTVKHWLPTREYKFVTDFINNGGIIPSNLVVRFSAHMIGGNVPKFPRLKGLVTISTVSKDDSYNEAHNCPARFQNNSCGDCRACWNPDVFHVDYHLH